MNRDTIVARSLGAIALFGLVVVATTAVAGELAGAWDVDGDQSQLKFVSDAPMERFTGTTDALEGTVNFDPDEPSAATGEIRFPVDSVKTGNSTRDRHLTQQSWLHADEYPNVRFEITEFRDVEVADTGDRLDFRGSAEGVVEMRGVEQIEDAEIEVAVLPDQKRTRVKFELDVAIEDYGVEGTRDRGIGANVGETIDIEGTIFADKE